MNTIQNNHSDTLKLEQRGFYRATEITPGTTLVCEQGIIWLTQSNDYKDYMLKSGDKLVVDKKSNVLIEALSDARLSILHNN